MAEINGGYILTSRKLINSPIMKKPPNYLKVWIYLLSKASFQKHGNLERGQGFCSIPELIEVCTHYAGARPIRATKKEIWGILEWLRNPHEGNYGGNTKGTMIETTKVTHGFVYTVVKYNYYQDPNNYEGNNEGNNEKPTKEQRKGQQGNNINKNGLKNEKNEKKKELVSKDTRGTSEPHRKIIETWNSLPIQNIKTINSGTNRYKMLNARIKEYGIDEVVKAISNIDESSFLKGQSKNGWTITFDWFIKPNNFIKVYENNYSDDRGDKTIKTREVADF